MMKPVNIEPKDTLYRGGWVKVCRCRNCKSIGYYYNFHPVNPCYMCGGDKDVLVGRWIYDEKPGLLARIFGRRNKGHWELKDKDE